MSLQAVKEHAKRFQDVLAADPLFKVIQGTPSETILFSEPYVEELNEKKFYSTAEVAQFFGISIKQVRYYIKPFQAYIFSTGETPSSQTAIRLPFTAILRLRMILLLKDEYRVKGLRELLGIDGEGHVNPRPFHSATTELAIQTDTAKKIETLSDVLNQLLMTGLFEIQQLENEENKITINRTFLQQQMNALPNDSAEQLQKIQEHTEQLKLENEYLKNQLEELTEQRAEDIAVKLRERCLENKVISQLQAEAVQEFIAQKKISFFKKLFHSAAIEREKELFVEDYTQRHLYKRLQVKMVNYYETAIL